MAGIQATLPHAVVAGAVAPTAPLGAGGGAAGAATSSTSASKSTTDGHEFLEVNSVSLEWKLGSLKQLFDQSKGETKSKCVKSAYFGQGKWQVFFYPNSGHDQYCSLYLSCQPTLEECERGALTAASGIQGKSSVDPTQVPWSREGLFKFTFEIKSLDRRVTFKAMEANDHAFSHEARNWGWAQYWRRNDAYYNNQAAKYNDAFLICCTIVYSPSPPSPPPPLNRRTVPNELLDAYASLFDDPANSDVCFRIVRYTLKHGKKTRQDKTLYASKKILGRRSDYFKTMFEGGFSEGHRFVPISASPTTPRNMTSAGSLMWQFSNIDEDESMDDTDSMMKEYEGATDLEEEEEDEDEEEEDDDQSMQESSDAVMEGTLLGNPAIATVHGGATRGAQVDSEASDPFYMATSSSRVDDETPRQSTTGISAPATQRIGSPVAHPRTSVADVHGTPNPVASALNLGLTSASRLNTPPIVANTLVVNTPITARPTSGLSQHVTSVGGGRRTPDDDVRMVGMQDADDAGMEGGGGGGGAEGWDIGAVSRSSDHGPRSEKKRDRGDHVDRSGVGKRSVVATGEGIGKQSGSGVRGGKRGGKVEKSERKMAEVVVTDASYQTFRALLYYLYTDSILFAPLNSTYICQRDSAIAAGQVAPYSSRAEHVQAVMMRIPLAPGQTFGVGPCSAKSIYRLADKIGLPDLKARSFDHIVRSLTAQNIPLEVFSNFTARYEEIRKVEIEYMLLRWNEVRNSPSLRLVLNSRNATSGGGGSTLNGFAGVWQILLSNLEYRPSTSQNPAGDVKEGGDGIN